MIKFVPLTRQLHSTTSRKDQPISSEGGIFSKRQALQLAKAMFSVTESLENGTYTKDL